MTTEEAIKEVEAYIVETEELCKAKGYKDLDHAYEVLCNAGKNN